MFIWTVTLSFKSINYFFIRTNSMQMEVLVLDFWFCFVLFCFLFVLFWYPRSTGGGILFYLCPYSVGPKIFFVAFFWATINGRNLIFGHKLHIAMPYCGKRFWSRRIPTSSCRLSWFYTHWTYMPGYHKWALAHSSSGFCFAFVICLAHNISGVYELSLFDFPMCCL